MSHIRTSIRPLLAGLLSGAVGVCMGILIAGLTGTVGSPVVAVAELTIDRSPPAVKDFAIRHFGSSDKLALQIGVLVVLAIFAAAIGILAFRKIWYGFAGVAIFGLVGLIGAATRPTFTPIDLLPSLVGAAAAGLTLYWLVRSAPRPSAGTAMASGSPASMAVATNSPDRRRFLGISAVAVGVAGVSYVGGRLLSERENVAAARAAIRLPRPVRPAPALPPGTDFRVPGLSPFVTSAANFYRVDTAIVIPEVMPTGWTLRIHGMVERELTITYGQLLRRPLIEDWLTLCCVSNPVGGPYIGNARWLGASLGALLREAGIKRGADQLFCTSADGFTSGTPVQTAMDGRDAMLAIAMNGQPLPTEHGFPVRTVVPGLYGYVSACKWITDIEVTTYAANAAYWVPKGWAPRGPIKTECRIDVPGNTAALKAGRTTIAGVAWAQHKGIEAVEVKVDNGPWREAQLAAVPGIDCWRQWLIDWDAPAGNHVIQARATDKTGYTQTAIQAPPPPNGASGYPAIQVQVTG